MAKLSLPPGTTSFSDDVYIEDTSGNPMTTLAFNTAGLKAYYHRPGGAPTAVSLVTQTIGGAYSSGGFVLADATNTPGLYRIDWPNAMFNSGVPWVSAELSGATSMRPVSLQYDLNANVQQMNGVGLAGPGAIPILGISESGTATAVGASSITFRVGTIFAADDVCKGQTVYVYNATTGQGQSRLITGYTNSTRVATVAAWTIALTGTVLYYVYPSALDSSLIAGITTLAQLQTFIQLNGAGPNYQFTAGGLALAPSGDPDLLLGPSAAAAGGTGTTCKSAMFTSALATAYQYLALQRTTAGLEPWMGIITGYDPTTLPPTVTVYPPLPGTQTFGASDTIKLLRLSPVLLANILHSGAAIGGIGNSGVTNFNQLLDADGLVKSAVLKIGSTFPLRPNGVGNQKYGA